MGQREQRITLRMDSAAAIDSLSHRLTAMPAPSGREPFGRGIRSWMNVLLARTPSVFAHGLATARESSSLPEGAPISAQPQRSAIVPAAARRRTGERRTEQQRKSQAAVRPREAIGAKMPPCKDKIGAKGGVQRGQMSPMRSQLPPLALFASFSGPRKKRQHEGQQTKRKTTNKMCFLCWQDSGAGFHLIRLRLAANPPSPRGEGFCLLLCGSLCKGDPLFCGWVSCFSNPGDSRKARGIGSPSGRAVSRKAD